MYCTAREIKDLVLKNLDLPAGILPPGHKLEWITTGILQIVESGPHLCYSPSVLGFRECEICHYSTS